jgi:phosphatidate cytidylyltransferase
MLILLLGAGLAVSLVGQMGDLVESVWKRALGIKDSSAIIPGHGGILDRFDSLLFAAPVLFWYLKYIVYS